MISSDAALERRQQRNREHRLNSALDLVRRRNQLRRLIGQARRRGDVEAVTRMTTELQRLESRDHACNICQHQRR